MKYDYAPSFKALRESLKLRSKEYFFENTLHGIPYIVDQTRPLWERVLWLILTLASLGATIGIIIIIWEKFQIEPMFMGLDTDTSRKIVDFPQIQLCFNWQNLNYSKGTEESDKKVLSRVYDIEWNTDRKFNDITFHGSVIDILSRVAPDCSVAFSNCTFNGNLDADCKKYLVKTIGTGGVCCVLASQPLTKEQAPWEFEFMPAFFPIRLYLLRKEDVGPVPGEEPLELLRVSTEIQLDTDVSYVMDGVKDLNTRQRQCCLEDECSTYETCRINCLASVLEKRCDCLPWFMLPPRERECNIDDYSCVNKYKGTKSCNCLLRCKYTAYNCKKIVKYPEVKTNNCKISIPTWPPVMYMRNIKFGPLDLLTSFGGIAGLFLGYSLLTTIELAYYFTLRSYCGAVIESPRKRHNIITVDVKRQKKVKKNDQNRQDDRNKFLFQYLD